MRLQFLKNILADHVLCGSCIPYSPFPSGCNQFEWLRYFRDWNSFHPFPIHWLTVKDIPQKITRSGGVQCGGLGPLKILKIQFTVMSDNTGGGGLESVKCLSSSYIQSDIFDRLFQTRPCRPCCTGLHTAYQDPFSINICNILPRPGHPMLFWAPGARVQPAHAEWWYNLPPVILWHWLSGQTNL